MLKTTDILDEKEKILHEKALEVTFPLDKEDKKVFEYNGIPLVIYRDEKLNTSYDILIIKKEVYTSSIAPVGQPLSLARLRASSSFSFETGF